MSEENKAVCEHCVWWHYDAIITKFICMNVTSEYFAECTDKHHNCDGKDKS